MHSYDRIIQFLGLCNRLKLGMVSNKAGAVGGEAGQQSDATPKETNQAFLEKGTQIFFFRESLHWLYVISFDVLTNFRVYKLVIFQFSQKLIASVLSQSSKMTKSSQIDKTYSYGLNHTQKSDRVEYGQKFWFRKSWPHFCVIVRNLHSPYQLLTVMSHWIRQTDSANHNHFPPLNTYTD